MCGLTDLVRRPNSLRGSSVKMCHRLLAATVAAVSVVAAGAQSSFLDEADTRSSEGHVADRRLTTGLAANLVMGRPVSLSQMWTTEKDGKAYSGAASKMADGDRGIDFFSGNGCAETTDMPDPWARIDFGRQVPVAAVRMWSRMDNTDPVELYVGNNDKYWYGNYLCASDVQLNRTENPGNTTCLYSGRYLFIVLRTHGARAKRLSLCEVEAYAKGPIGTKHILRTAGVMWSLKLDGLAFNNGDRVRIVANSVLCGQKFSSDMHPSVLDLTSPKGQRSSGNYTTETWANVQINRMGIYKVCWCGNVGGCTTVRQYFMHVATLVINGVIKTISGTGEQPVTEDDLKQGEVMPATAKLTDPYGVAATQDRIFFSERKGHRIRYLNLMEGKMFVLCGDLYSGTSVDGTQAKMGQLSTPMGIALSLDHKILYIADSGNHKIRELDIGTAHPELSLLRTVAGTGHPGYSGDGGKAVQAQLNTPACVNVDLSSMLWICDWFNNRIRVVSLGKQTYLVPGTNEYKSNIILTAAGDGIIGTKGDGGSSMVAQVGAPASISVSSGFLSVEEGFSPTVAFIANEKTHVVKSIALEFKSYLGVMGTVSGKGGTPGYSYTEATPDMSTQMHLDSPQGLTTDDGVLYVSDTGNNRLLMYPLMEYIAIGCWRENHKVPWIPKIEGQVPEFLDGNPELRETAIKKCALAALKLGFEAFAVRQWGYCAAGPSVLLDYKREGSSTSCANGLGGARDNSVYKFARGGYQVLQKDIVYVLSGRKPSDLNSTQRAVYPKYAGDDVPAWDAQMNAPTGLAINPLTKDIWFADGGNDRLRMIFYQIGPNPSHNVLCTNGNECIVQLMGNALRPANRLGILPLKYRCGEKNSTFLRGFQVNPVGDVPSPSFTTQAFNLGVTEMALAGTYRLCYCTYGSVMFGYPADCKTPVSYIQDAGILQIEGPNMETHTVARAGVAFDLAIYGTRFLHQDRIRVIRRDQHCGGPGANVSAAVIMDKNRVDGFRHLGKAEVSIWPGVTILQAGHYRACWCQGTLGSGTGQRCKSAKDFAVHAGLIEMLGPVYYEDIYPGIPMSFDASLILRGSGLDAGDRIRIVDVDQECGTMAAEHFSAAVESYNGVPSGAPETITSDSQTWQNVKIRLTNKLLRVCWCGSRFGCSKGSDFNVLAMHFMAVGPITQPLLKISAPSNPANPGYATDFFDLKLPGTSYTGREQIKIVDSYTKCGTMFANISTPDLNVSEPEGPTFVNKTHIEWAGLRLLRIGIYRVCMCGCALPGSILNPCCTQGADFFLEVAALYVSTSKTLYEPLPLDRPIVGSDRDLTSEAPGIVRPTIPRNRPRRYRVSAKTRDSPAHAGSMGPIDIVLYTYDNVPFPFTINFTNMATGTLAQKDVTFNLPKDMQPTGIYIQSYTTDAWFCEYVSIEIEMAGKFVFPCGSWTALPTHREARRATNLMRQWIAAPVELPRPQMAMWERRYFPIDACGGCMNGYECSQQRVPHGLRMLRSLNDSFMKDYGMAAVNGKPGVAEWEAVCKPICGDGYAATGEECDDGNLFSMDGCNAQCQVEQQFECVNFPDMPSRCYFRMCTGDWQARGFWNYNDNHYKNGSILGWSCAADQSLSRMAPAETLKLCYPWDEGVVPVKPDTGNTGRRRRTVMEPPGVCPAGVYNEKLEEVKAYSFNPKRGTQMGCPATYMKDQGFGLLCMNGAAGWEPPMGSKYYYNKSTCFDECFYDSHCETALFNIGVSPGADECPPGTNAETCKANCTMMNSCTPMMAPGSLGSHIAVKMKRTQTQIKHNFLCVEGKRPRPAWAYESQGMITVQMDSPTERPENVALYENFPCSHALAPSGQVAVGGEGVPCRWVDDITLLVMLGPLATVNQPMQSDKFFQYFGNPGLLAFDSRKLRPRGVSHDYWPWFRFPMEEYNVVVRRIRPFAIVDGGMPALPNVIIRGPSLLGGCASLSLTADISNMGGGRRWQSVKWTCESSRPDPSLPTLNSRMNEYDACTTRIQPYLDKKSWCRDKLQNKATVAEPCELWANLPPDIWCGLSQIRFACELTSAAGIAHTGYWTTDINPAARLPVAIPVGPSEYHMSPQRYVGDPLPRLRFQVSTDNDIESVGKCGCNMSSVPTLSTSEGEIVIQWLYGEMIDNVPPRQDALYPVFGDESILANVMQLPLRGAIARPGSDWQYVARVAYKSVADKESTLVRFTVRVGPLQPPDVAIRAPMRAYGAGCSFEVSALESRIRELLFWAGRRLYEVDPSEHDAKDVETNNDELRERERERKLQVTTTSTTSTTVTTTRNLISVPMPQSLRFSWKCYQMKGKADDQATWERGMKDVRSLLNAICRTTAYRLEIPVGALPPGLFVFSAFVEDNALPGAIGMANVTVEITPSPWIAFWPRGPAPLLRPTEDAYVEFWHLGGGAGCPAMPDSVQITGTALLFMRGVIGQPLNSMRSLANISVHSEERFFPIRGQFSRVWIFHANITRKLLHPGFQYAFRIIATTFYPTEVEDYKTILLASRPNVSGVQRVIDVQPPKPHPGVWITDTDPFSVYGGPISGSLECMNPPGGKGFSMQTLFLFHQIWATDEPPLEYAYFYSQVPESKRADFLREQGRGFADEGSLERLRKLIPNEKMSVLSEWTQDPVIEMPMPTGMWVIEGHVRDRVGVNNTRAILVEAMTLFPADAHILTIPAALKLERLAKFVADSMMVILHVRAKKKAPMAIVPVCAGINELPEFGSYDFLSMKTWTAASFEPQPILSQTRYGTPIVPKEMGDAVILYVKELLNILGEILLDLHDEGFRKPATPPTGPEAGGLERRLPEDPYNGTYNDNATYNMTPAEAEAGSNLELEHLLQVNFSDLQDDPWLDSVDVDRQLLQSAPSPPANQPTNVEILSKALRQLSYAVQALYEPELYLMITALVSKLLLRLRLAKGIFKCSNKAIDDLLHTIAAVMAGIDPAMIPRPGIISVNVTEDIQARLSQEIFLATEQLGDYVAACTPYNNHVELAAPLPPGAGGGMLKLTILVRPLSDVISEGFSLSPDYQSMEEWPYPRVRIAGLGPPGFMARKWVGSDSPRESYSMSGCYSESESFLERVSLMVVSWPLNPVVYSSGSLVDVQTNVTNPYSLQIRSCGQAVKVENLQGKTELTFRMDPVTVRDRRWGYGDVSPYRIVWWQDAPGAGALRVRRWTTQGCRTAWKKTEEDVIIATCDRLPSIYAGSVYSIELIPRPPYVVEEEPPENSSFHNALSYLLYLIVARAFYLWYFAHRGDNNFFPSEKELMTIQFLPLEQTWRDARRRGIAVYEDQTWSFWQPEFWVQLRQAMTVQSHRFQGAMMALKGNDMFFSLEVQELRLMRSGGRSVVYERFYASLQERDPPPPQEFPDLPQIETGGARKPSKVGNNIIDAVSDLQGDQFSQHGRSSSRSNVRLSSKPSLLPGLTARSEGSRHSRMTTNEVDPYLRHALQDNPMAAADSQQLSDIEDNADENDYEQQNWTGRVLPEGWEAVEADEGSTYYVNRLSLETQWDVPTERAKHRDPKTKKQRGMGRLGTLRHAVAAQRGDVEEDQLALLSDTQASASGNREFHNNATHQSEPPEGGSPVLGCEDVQLRATASNAVDACAAPVATRVLQDEVSHAMAPGEVGEREVPSSSSCTEALAPNVMGRVFYAEAKHSSAPDDSPRTNEKNLRDQVARQQALAANSDEVPLPLGWEMHKSPQGRQFYVNARSGLSQWAAPRLPVHWEERLSSNGRIYYLSLFDGHTQWDWPHEIQGEMTRSMLESSMELPGRTLSPPLALEQGAVDTIEQGTPSGPMHLGLIQALPDEDEVDAVDQVDAGVILCMEVEGFSRSSSVAVSPRSDKDTEMVGIIAQDDATTCQAKRIAKLPKWGEDQADSAWAELHEKLEVQARANQRRHTTAKAFPGVREFVQTHELHDQVNQWDKQFEVANEKLDNVDRRGKILGKRAECDKEDMRVTFPIIQRLQWTKWPAWELFVHTMARDMPTWHMFVNIGRPSKYQRCTSHLLFLAVALLGSTLMLAFEAPVSENLAALDIPFWELILQVFSMPLDSNIFWVAILADLAARSVQGLCDRVFFSYTLPGNRRPPMTENDRVIQLMLWHQMADFGKWVCTLGIVVCIAGAATLCAQFPQPRSASVVRSFLLGVLWMYIIHPALKGLFAAFILDIARSLPVFDAVLTVFPNIMDFLGTGVKTPQFLSWRTEKMVSELEMMRRVHKETPEIGGPSNPEDEDDDDE